MPACPCTSQLLGCASQGASGDETQDEPQEEKDARQSGREWQPEIFLKEAVPIAQLG